VEQLVRIIGASDAHVLGRANGRVSSIVTYAQGGARTEAEAQRMITEKVAALAEAQLAAPAATLKGSKPHRVAKKALAAYAGRVPIEGKRF
jgi:hypothetical protein